MTQIFVAWISFQRRIVSMEAYFGYEPICIPVLFKQWFLKPLDYFLKTAQTLTVFLKQKPQVIWIQQPPSPLLYLAHFYKACLDRQVKIVADCHNASLRKPWNSSPFLIPLLNRCDVVLVHNKSVLEQALDLGILSERLVVLRDRTSTIECSNLHLPYTMSRPWILAPCSFSSDEPIEQIFIAARQAPELTFIITGNQARAAGRHNLTNIPSNLKLMGFLPRAEFDALLCQADIVLGLTKLEGIQLSVAGEAVSVGKPMVLSDTATSRQLFYKGAIYVDPLNPESIAQGCRDALLHQSQFKHDICELREESDRQWLEQADQVWHLLKK